MAPTLEPPPSTAASSISTSHAASMTLSISSILKNLQTLIFNIALPKTKTAKICSFPLDALQKARKLITSACGTYEQQKGAPQLSSIKEQLDVISNHIGLATNTIPSAKQVPQKANSKESKYDITLSQWDRSNPVFSDTCNEDSSRRHSTLQNRV
ncbi:hypothetical protein M422DRAFT_245237 [Sphaerobolus stellatus SS14]|nr:hypothetical protein M422DRAFT_245237 [Sphaerobolus stellatus SS14]